MNIYVNMKCRLNHISTFGFSLIEVVVSIGIAAFGFVSVFGMLSTGLGTFRRALDTSIGSQITQRVLNETQQADFDTLFQNKDSGSQNSFVMPVRYFDDSGNELAKTDTHLRIKAIYQVNTRIVGSTPTLSTSNTAIANTNLATIIVQIAKAPATQTIILDPITNLWGSDKFQVSSAFGLSSRGAN